MLARPPLVGRSAEMDRLAAQLSHAARGQGCAMFLVGEAGIGKTRLAHEAVALAREQGFLVLEGCAYALEGRLAYAPILTAFGSFLRRLDSSRQAKLVSGLSDLGRLFPDLRLPAAEPLGDAALEKTRLFEAVARLLERLARETPVLLFVDDLHWADPASIELLHYLARGVADCAVLVLGTHRADEVDTARGLRSLLTSLRRAGLAEEVRIARLGQEAVAALAERLGSRRVLAEAYLSQIRSFSADLDVVAARAVAQRGLAEAELADEPLLVQRAHDILALFAYGLGEHTVARHHAMLSLALARQLGAPTLELYPRSRLVSVDLMAGKWNEALRESAEILATARRLGFARGIASALGMRALVQVYRGDLDEAAACLAEAHEVFGGIILDRNIFSPLAITEMMLALERADAAGILAAAKRLDQMLATTDFPLSVQALLAEAKVMFGESERALTLAQDFMAHIPPDNGFATALGNRIKGLAHQALGQPGEALACLEEASRAFTAAEMPFDAARARLEWATLAATTDEAASAQALQESLAVFERLGARRYARRARRLLYKLGIRPRSMLYRPPSATPLSPRELEIVQLVAEDLTNAEIAERLIISPRTVTTHLDRIYTRLGINSRTALVRYAIEAGLLPSTDRSR